MLTDKEVKNLENNQVTIELLEENGLEGSYYTAPLQKLLEMGVKVTVTGYEWKNAVELSVDEGNAPIGTETDSDFGLDGILALIFEQKLEEVGWDWVGYFHHRCNPYMREEMMRDFNRIDWSDCFSNKEMQEKALNYFFANHGGA